MVINHLLTRMILQVFFDWMDQTPGEPYLHHGGYIKTCPPQNENGIFSYVLNNYNDAECLNHQLYLSVSCVFLNRQLQSPQILNPRIENWYIYMKTNWNYQIYACRNSSCIHAINGELLSNYFQATCRIGKCIIQHHSLLPRGNITAYCWWNFPRRNGFHPPTSITEKCYSPEN